MKKETVSILDFGSQYTKLIARKVREQRVYCEILSYKTRLKELKSKNTKAVILSGGPQSVYRDGGKHENIKEILSSKLPILAICYGMQVVVDLLGGEVNRGDKGGEYGRAHLEIVGGDGNGGVGDKFFYGVSNGSMVWMSHGDSVRRLPNGFHCIGKTKDTRYAAIVKTDAKAQIYCLQFHPEVMHTLYGEKMLRNFLYDISMLSGTWTERSFIDEILARIRAEVGEEGVVCGLSGGVDSAVAALLINKAIGNKLNCIFVDNGLLREGEREGVVRLFEDHFKIKLNIVKAKERFLKKLEGVEDPEEKRKRIGHEFIRVFEEAARRLGGANILVQGTLYPDIIESSLPNNPSEVIKSHHNVGGLPKAMDFKIVEPLKELFKDEVRKIGIELGLPLEWVWRHPFPGPGLAIRVIGEVTKSRLKILRLSDKILLDEIKDAGLYDKIWQAFTVLLPVKTVGVMGDKRTYDNVVGIRCVNSKDGMTANWYVFPSDVLGRISSRIINEVYGVNRVVYDITSKPPGTIEWE